MNELVEANMQTNRAKLAVKRYMAQTIHAHAVPRRNLMDQLAKRQQEVDAIDPFRC